MPNPDDLTHQYQQTIAESNRKIFSIEPVQVGTDVYMGTVQGGKETEGKGTVLKGQEPAQTAPPAEPSPHDALIDQAASRHGLDPALLKAVVQAESSGRAKVTNQKGATGLMQLMPETAAEMGVQDATDPAENLEGGAKYLSNLMKQYDGDTEKALAAYNFGPGNVAKGKPLPKETQAYVQKIMAQLPKAPAPPGDERAAVTPRREFTVDTPQAQQVRQDWQQKFQELSTGETAVKEVGKIGKQVAEAVRPGFEVAAMALGMDEEAAATVGQAFVEFMGGLPAEEHSDFAAGVETLLAALPAVAGMYKIGKTVGGAAVEGIVKNKEAILQEFEKAWKVVKSERGSIRLGASGLQPEELTKLSQAFQETIVHTQAAQDPKILEHFAKAREGVADWTGSVKGQTRSVLSDPEVLRLSKKSNLTMEAILGLPPGTSLPIEDMQKVYTVLEDAFHGMQRATIQVKQRGLPEDYQTFFASIGEVRTITRTLLGLHAEAGRALRGTQVREVSDEAMSAQQRLAARDAAERPQISDPWVEQLYEFFEEQDQLLYEQGGGAATYNPGEAMRQLVEAVAELKSPEQLTQFIKSIEDPRFWDAWTEQWYNALLTGLAVVKNVVGSPVIGFAEVGSRAFAAGINSIGTGMVRHVAQTDMPRNIYMGETGAMLYGALEAFGTGLRGAWYGFTKMKPLIPGQTSMAGELIVPKVSSTSQYLHLTGFMGRAMDYFSSFGPRLLVAGDNFNSALAYQAQLRALALRKGYQTVYAEGLSGAEAAQRIQQIKTEVFANSEKHLELHAEAEVFAAYVTLQEKLGESGQAISTFASTLTIGDPARGGLNGFPIGRVLAPFTKITTNSTKMAGEWTGPLSLASQAVRDEIAAGGARRDAAMGKVAFSTLFVATMWELAANKLITGTGPKDPDARRQLEATGWKPNAWWDPVSKAYRPMTGFEPFNTVAGGTADLYDILSHAPTSQDWVQRTQLGIEALKLAVANNVGVKPYLMGLIGLANGVFSGSMDEMDTYMKKQVPSLVTPYSGGLRQIKQGIDPTMRQALDFNEAMMKDLPGLSATLPPERDRLGDPIRRTGGFWNPWAHGEKSANAPVWQALTDHSIVLGSVGDVIDGVKLTGWQKDKYVQLATEGLAEELDDALVGKEMTDQEAERIVRQAQTWRRKQAQQIMRDGDYFPELALKLEEQQERKAEGDPIKQSPFSAGKLRKSDFEAPTLR